MKKMDNTSKSILLGVGVAFIVGILTFLFSTDTAQKKTKKAMRHHKMNKYKKKLPGHKSKTRKFLDKLSDEDLNDLFGSDDLGDKFSDMGSDLKDFMQDKTKDTKKLMKKMK